MNFPTLSVNPSVALGQDSRIKTLKSPTEDGYVITRSAWTRAKKVFSVKYNALSVTDYNTLLSFFEDNAKGAAEVFNWTHPVSSTVYEVRFKDDILQAEYITSSLVSCSFVLEEV